MINIPEETAIRENLILQEKPDMVLNNPQIRK